MVSASKSHGLLNNHHVMLTIQRNRGSDPTLQKRRRFFSWHLVKPFRRSTMAAYLASIGFLKAKHLTEMQGLCFAGIYLYLVPSRKPFTSKTSVSVPKVLASPGFLPLWGVKPAAAILRPSRDFKRAEYRSPTRLLTGPLSFKKAKSILES